MAKNNSKQQTSTMLLVGAQAATELHDLMAAKKAWSARLLQTPRAAGFHAFAAAAGTGPEQNVQGVGVGEKLQDGKPTGIMSVKFFVRQKYPADQLGAAETLPSSIDGLPTDVEETGLFRALEAKQPKPALAMPNPRKRFRPARPGCSIGFQFPPPSQTVMAGTFGAVVKSGSDLFILSNNHVLADEDRLAPGAPIFQPGLLDGGKAKKDKVAELTRALKLEAKGFNQADCALAEAINVTILSRDILHIGPPAGTAQAAIDMRVHKFGRTTGYTVGRVTSIATDVTVTYDTGTYAFEDQIIVVGDGRPFSAAGDSGSLILDRQSNNAVGLLFAGSSTHTIANHITIVLQALNVTLA